LGCDLELSAKVGGDEFMTFLSDARRDRNIDGDPPLITFSVTYPNRKYEPGTSLWEQEFFQRRYLVVESDENDRSEVISEYTGSEESWRVAMGWLEKCLKTHTTCGRARTTNWKPTRLLDVGNRESKFIRLSETVEEAPILPYVTLSHCWGGIEIKRLLRDDRADMLNNIRIDELPKTFQDAIAITRRLGVRYLWIDSLCIVQDSTEDWARESSMMGQVYQNGFCNIAATGAEDGRVGCFLKRDVALVQKFSFRIHTPIPKFGLKPGLYDMVPRDLWSDGLWNAALNKRAWVAQERILAPRILHFSATQLYWECNELVSSFS
jgi:hypothetical protein